MSRNFFQKWTLTLTMVWRTIIDLVNVKDRSHDEHDEFDEYQGNKIIPNRIKVIQMEEIVIEEKVQRILKINT